MGNDLKFYVGVLRSDRCMCGRAKKPRRAFCFGCFVRLPDGLRRALYNPIGAGFEQTYDECCRRLDKRQERSV